MTKAKLGNAYIVLSRITDSNLTAANLEHCRFIGGEIKNSLLSNCRIFGCSVWDLKIENTTQEDLIITKENDPLITIDNIEIAQFVYLLLKNEKLRAIIDTITTKVVLILGAFSDERKAVLNAIREEIRKYNYIPIMFDFEKPATRDLTETITTLAHLARFIIVDLTDPRSVPHEIRGIIPNLAIPVKPIIESTKNEYGMFVDLQKKYHWVLDTLKYEDKKTLLNSLKTEVIDPCENKLKDLKKG